MEKMESVLQSNGQIMIPQNIRDYLGIEDEDIVLFDIDQQGRVYLEKRFVCPLCHGKGAFSGEHICLACLGSGDYHQEPIAELHRDLLYTSKDYGVSISFLNQYRDPNGEIQSYLIPRIILSSNTYPMELLEKTNDYFQLRMIELYSPKNDLGEYDISMDTLNKEIIGLLKTEDARNEALKLFGL